MIIGAWSHLPLIVLGVVLHLGHVHEFDEVTRQGRPHVPHTEVPREREGGTCRRLGLTVALKHLQKQNSILIAAGSYMYEIMIYAPVPPATK